MPLKNILDKVKEYSDAYSALSNKNRTVALNGLSLRHIKRICALF